jgi:phospholipase/carboxylesterase
MAARLLVFLLSLALVVGCTKPAQRKSSAEPGTITARPGRGAGACALGIHPLPVGSGRKAMMRVTPGASRGRRALILALHGAGSHWYGGLYAFRGGWDMPGLVLVAPEARASTWSFLFGHDDDLGTVNRALAQAFRRCRIDRRRIGVGGFSDGATYALSLGLANGRLFRAVMALSPGGIVGDKREGKPRIFIGQGTKDDVLPFRRTRDELVPGLRRDGYDVTFRTFVGGHKVVESESRAAVLWFLRRAP